MGLFNLLSPLFGAVDAALATLLPAVPRIALWAAILAIGTMILYKWLSPQKSIGVAKREAHAARQRLNRFDGEFADAGPLIRAQFATAFRHIGLVVPGTILAILPLLCFLVWADNHFDYALPGAGARPGLSTVPSSATGVTLRWDSTPPRITLVDAAHNQHSYPLRAPVPEITKHHAWNWLVGNPLGYLPDDAPVQAVRIHLPQRELLHIGPHWMHGWLAVFLPVMFIVSLLMFKWARIE